MSRTLREVKADDVAEFEVGQVIKADAFSEGDLVDVIGTSKGKGFAGWHEATRLQRWSRDTRSV